MTPEYSAFEKTVEHAAHGQTYEIDLLHDEEGIFVRAYVKTPTGRSPIFPPYGATLTVANDYYHQHKDRLAEHLIATARSDIDLMLYIKPKPGETLDPLSFKPNLA